jgi:hypothetical protein
MSFLVMGLSDYRRGFDWRPDLLHTLLQRVTTLYNSLLHTHTSVHIQVFTAVVWQRLPTADVPLTLGSRTVTGLTYQLLTATVHNATESQQFSH